MRLESYRERFMARIPVAVRNGAEDAARHSAALPGSPSDLHAEHPRPGVSRIGSNKRYAKAQERGAFIRPRRARALKFSDGTFRMVARIPAKHYLRNTGRRWRSFLLPHLRVR